MFPFCTVVADMKQIPFMHRYSGLLYTRHVMSFKLFSQGLLGLCLTSCLMQEELLTISALSEIGIGFWLLVKMWYNPWSYALQVYTYWKCHLPLRYAMPESAPYHKRVSISSIAADVAAVQSLQILSAPRISDSIAECHDPAGANHCTEHGMFFLDVGGFIMIYKIARRMETALVSS